VQPTSLLTKHTPPSSPKDAVLRTINAISVDVEDYFQTEAMTRVIPRNTWESTPSRIERNMKQILELFSAHCVRGTFFFLGWVAERYPHLVRETRDLGHEIACHSYWHRPIYTLSPAEFREDTHRAKAVIEDAAGAGISGYRAPSFSLTPGTEWAADILAQAGFAYDSSVHPIAHDLYENRHAPRHPYRLARNLLLEIPISTVRWGKRNYPFSGGGYFRVLPYRYVRWAMRRVNQLEGPAVFYLHPWEIDPEQPRLTTSGRSAFRQYTRLDKTAGLLSRLLTEFSFGPLEEVFAEAAAVQPQAETPSGVAKKAEELEQAKQAYSL
jgi:polysaccharide deacetylase family protein (PEP-CTERM system associated)